MSWRAWPGPPQPMLAEAAALEAGLDILASARAHVPTQRLRVALPLLGSLALILPVAFNRLPWFLLLTIPLTWLVLPWMIRREWLATEAVFAADRLIVRRGERDKAPAAILLDGVSLVSATQDRIQARTGSCTLHFLRIVEEASGELRQEPVVVVRDVEAALAHHILTAYAQAGSTPK